MNWGGIIAGAIGGGAQAVGEIADQNLKEQAVERAEKRSLQLNFEKFKQETDHKLQKEAQRRSMIADQGERLMDRAGSNMRKQDAMAIDLLNNKVAGESPDMSQEEIAQLLKDNPEYRQIWEQARYMDPRKQSGIIGEQVTAAREIGADPEIRKDLQDTLTRTLTAERDASRDAATERRLTETERANRESERIRDAQAAAMAARSGPSGKEGLSDALRYLESARKAIGSELDDLRRMEKEEAGTVFSLEEKKQIRDKYAELRKGLEGKAKTLDDDFKIVRGRLFTDEGGGVQAPRPTPNAKPGSKPDWQSEQSYSDQVQIILAEYRKETNPETKAALARELKRLGVDPTKQSGDNVASAPTARPPLETFRK